MSTTAQLTEVRRPGVRFVLDPPAARGTLPRMDVTGFVGFAASGPLHLPVAVEDVDRFRAIFGGAWPLALDPATGEVAHTYLAPAVEDFFKNGGRRCWVVRVADADTAAVQSFAVPGLVSGDTLRPALAAARSPGSWADGLRLGSMLERRSLRRLDFTPQPGDYRLRLLSPPEPLAAGELIELRFAATGLLVYLAVDEAVPGPGTVDLHATKACWLRRWLEPPPVTVSAAALARAGGDVALPLPAVQLAEAGSTDYGLEFHEAVGTELRPGDLVRVTVDGRDLLVVLAEVTGSELDADGLAVAGEGWWPEEESTAVAAAQTLLASSPPDATPFVDQLRLELRSWRGRSLEQRLGELALGRDHTRFWGRLPQDHVLFGRDRDGRPLVTGALVDEASEPRFPFAGPQTPAELYLPLGMGSVPSAEAAAGPAGAADPESALDRDGLARFGAELFLDPHLKGTSTAALTATVHDKLYVKNAGRGLSVHGLHALQTVAEVSLLAVPDAVHPGWQKSAIAPPAGLEAPDLAAPAVPSGTDPLSLSWTWNGDGNADFRLQEASDPNFATPSREVVTEEVSAALPIPAGCPERRYYRVRAESGGVSPWSRTRSVVLPEAAFASCIEVVLEAPQLGLAAGGEDLEWAAVDGAEAYVVVESPDPSFAAESVVGDESPYRLPGGEQDLYYRVRATAGGGLGPWSNTVRVAGQVPSAYRLVPGRGFPELLAVQRSALRFCAARQDLMAILSLPREYREDEVTEHLAHLTVGEGDDPLFQVVSGVPALTRGEKKALGFGALYHPWIFRPSSGTGGALLGSWAPPEGAVGGTFAALSLARGAWLAPANVPLRDVVDLDPDVSANRLRPFPVNLVETDARGFLVLEADTLSAEEARRPISVRRLLMLLYRLMLREGDAWVFEPHDQAFRRQVETRFTRLLADLFVRGAFAGRSPEEAFRVLVDDSVNPAAGVEAGRFVVEIAVAPALPLEFLTVRLVQGAEEPLTVLEN